MRDHIQSKHEGVKYTCNHCDYKAGYRHNLRIHMKGKHRNEHSKKEEPKRNESSQFINCPECGIQFSSNNSMESHFLQAHDYD